MRVLGESRRDSEVRVTRNTPAEGGASLGFVAKVNERFNFLFISIFFVLLLSEIENMGARNLSKNEG